MDPSKVIRIHCLERPECDEPGEGEYEVVYGHDPKKVYTHDCRTLRRELDMYPQISTEKILTYLLNFRLAYINFNTVPPELTTGVLPDPDNQLSVVLRGTQCD